MCDGSFSNVQFFLDLYEDDFAMYWSIHEQAIKYQQKYIEAQRQKRK